MNTTLGPRRIPVPPRDLSKEPVVVLRGGTLLDGTDAAPVKNAVVVMQGNVIRHAGPAASATVPAGAKVIDVSGLYVVPGLIDLHMHFRQQRGNDFQLYRDSEAAIAIRGVEKLGLYLDGGITTVRELGGPGDVAQKLNEAVQRGIFPGPRIFYAGRIIISRGGHGDEVTETASGRPKSLETSAGVRVATGPSDWRLAVREQIRLGADVIKMAAPFTKDEVAAAIDEAHMLGIPLTVDAFGDYVKWAADAGIDCIEHPLSISPETISVMAAKKTNFVPTITAFYNPLKEGYPSADIPAGGFFFTMSRRFYVTHEENLETLKRARAAGLKVGIGTDIAFENEKRYPGDYFKELGFFKEAGYTESRDPSGRHPERRRDSQGPRQDRHAPRRSRRRRARRRGRPASGHRQSQEPETADRRRQIVRDRLGERPGTPAAPTSTRGRSVIVMRATGRSECEPAAVLRRCGGCRLCRRAPPGAARARCPTARSSFVGGLLIDATGQPPRHDQAVVIKGDRIVVGRPDGAARRCRRTRRSSTPPA